MLFLCLIFLYDLKFYIFRKEAIALVKLISGDGKIIINNKDFTIYFQNNPKLVQIVLSPFVLLGLNGKFDVSDDLKEKVQKKTEKSLPSDKTPRSETKQSKSEEKSEDKPTKSEEKTSKTEEKTVSQTEKVSKKEDDDETKERKKAKRSKSKNTRNAI